MLGRESVSWVATSIVVRFYSRIGSTKPIKRTPEKVSCVEGCTMFIAPPPKTFESPYNIRSEVYCLRVFAALQFLESSANSSEKPSGTLLLIKEVAFSVEA
jgi:hypothetical protein